MIPLAEARDDATLVTLIEQQQVDSVATLIAIDTAAAGMLASWRKK